MWIFKISLSIFFSLFALFISILRILPDSEYSTVGHFLSSYFGWILWMWIFIVFLLANIATTAYLFKFKPNLFKVSVVKMLWLLFWWIVFIYVCVFGYMYYTFSERQKAYDLKEQCSMNGLWSGKCVFTNLWNSSNHKCGKIVVANQDGTDISSAVFCSWEIPPKDTKNIEFSVIWMAEKCKSNGNDWRDSCSFNFKTISDK